jgi:uncharacterized protein YdeI (BOF family)
MKKYIVIALLVLAPTLAFAGDASLKNTDSSAHELKIKCSSTSTRSIQSGTVIKVKDGCKISVEGGNTVTVSSGDSCKIKSGDISC